MVYNLAQIVECAAAQFPEKDAFRCLDESISYEELDQKANRLANFLIKSGVNRGDRIGIYMGRCLESTIAVYGVLKAGAAYIPLDPFVPVSHTLFMIDDCEMKHLITTEKQNRKIPQLAEEAKSLKSVIGTSLVIDIETIAWDDIYSITSDIEKPVRILEDDLAFILYTSGSTGTPKGVMHTHHSGLALARLAADLYDFGPDDRIGNFAPLYFDPSTFGYFSAPLSFSTTIIFPDAYLKFPKSLCEIASKEKITIWYSVPLVLIQALLHGSIEKYDFSSLRWVLFIGEVFILKHLKALMEQWKHAKFSNLYGPVEVIACTYYNMSAPPKGDSPIPIGQVWGNTECKILDENDKEVKKGEIGQLIVRTATLMKGYWNNKALTAKSLYKEKIADGLERVYYKTGDLAQEDKDGLYLFHGRNDRQVKIRGYRLELDAIELALVKHNEVEEVAVVAIDRDTGVKELAAVINLIQGSQLTSVNLENFCKSVLPPYSVPETIKILDSFPRTSSGKISRTEITRLIETKEI